MATNCGCYFLFTRTIFISTFVCMVFADNKNEDLAYFENNSLEITMMQSKDEKYFIYRNRLKQECYIEELITKHSSGEQKSRTLYVSSAKITKSNPIYRQLDVEILEFCKNFSILILKEQPPFYKNGENRFRKRRQIETNKKFRYGGQTQTQFISFNNEKGNEDDVGGIAEAIAEQNRSRATVNGRIGMGQAQSQSNYDDCDECGPQTTTETRVRGQPVFSTISGQPPQTENNTSMTTKGLQGGLPGNPSIPNSQWQTGRPGQTVREPQISNPQSPTTSLQNPIPGHLEGTKVAAQTPGEFGTPQQQYPPNYQNAPGQILSYQQPLLTNYPNVGSLPHQPSVAYPHVGMMSPTGDPQQNTRPFQPSIQKLPVTPVLPNYFNGASTIQSYLTFPGYPQHGVMYGAQNGFAITPQRFPSETQLGTPNLNYPSQTAGAAPAGMRTGNPIVNFQTQSGYLPQRIPSEIHPGTSYVNYPMQIGYSPLGTILGNQYGTPGSNYLMQPGFTPQGTLLGTQSGPNVNSPAGTGYISQSTPLGAQPGPNFNSPTGVGYIPQRASLETELGGSNMNYPTNNVGYVPQGIFPANQLGTPVQAGFISGGTFPGTQAAPMNVNYPTQLGSRIEPGTSNINYPVHTGFTSGVYPAVQTGSQNMVYPIQTEYAPQGTSLSVQTGIPSTNYPSTGVTQGVQGNHSQAGYVGQGNFPNANINYLGQMGHIPQGVSSGMQNVNYPAQNSYSGGLQNTYPFQTGDSSQSVLPPPSNGVTRSYIPNYLGQSASTNVGSGPITPTNGFPAENTTQSKYQPFTGQIGYSPNQLNRTGSQTISGDTESGETQSLSSLYVRNNETKAEASAQGKTKSGLAQAQVSGTYTGSFSAQAQTGDDEKSVQTQIFGNKTGATSSSEGRAGKIRSQSQILYSHETGTSLAEAQGGGVNYGLNSQIQVGKLGGKADAQSSGSGSTSSQAQIGFGPSDENSEQQSIFEGGGTSSSQNGAQSGRIQTQFQGSFRFGPSFTGAAQSSAGGGNRNAARPDFNSTNLSSLGRNVDFNLDKGRVSSTWKENSVSQAAIPENDVIKSTLPLESVKISEGFENRTQSHSVHPTTNNDEEDDDDGEKSQKQIHSDKKDTDDVPSQTQNAYVNSKTHDAYIHRESSDAAKNNKIFNSGDVIPGTNNYKVPNGFRGRVISAAGDKTEALATAGGGKAQTQTVVLKPGSGLVTVVDPSRPGHYLPNDSGSADNTKNGYDGYVTVTKSETGELNNGNRKYAHTYYTKSSTCGYFTFTCNLIDGTNGKTKICTPGLPTYADGSPCLTNA